MADSLGTHLKRAGLVHRAADHAVPLPFLHGQRFAGDHRFVDRAAAREQDAVDRHFFTWHNFERVALADLVERQDPFRCGAHDARAVGGASDQQPARDGAAGPLPGPQLQHLA